MAIRPSDRDNSPKAISKSSPPTASRANETAKPQQVVTTGSGAIPHIRNGEVSLINPKHRYAAKIQVEDRSSPKLRLIQAKKRIAEEIEKDFTRPQSRSNNPKNSAKALMVNSAFIHGPSGAFSSDIFLQRALKNLEKEQANINTKDGASNIVIIGRRKSSCERMARRLIRLADPKTRTDLEGRIDVLDSYTVDKNNEQESPRIIFIPNESLNNVLRKKSSKANSSTDTSRDENKVKRDLTDLTKYIGLKRLKYLYFDHAHTMTSRGRSLIFEYLKKNMDGRVGTGFQEIIGSSYCNKFHVDGEEVDDDQANVRDIRDKLDRHYSLPSPGELYRVALPDMYPAEIKDTSIGLELPEEEQIKGVQKNFTYEKNFASNETWIREHLIEGKREGGNKGANGLEVLYKEIQEEGVENPRVMISTQRVKTAEIIRDILIEKGYKVGVTNANGNKYSTSQDQEFSTDDRTELLDKFGKEFNILIHCGTLDGEEIPADLTMVYKVPNSSESLEKYTSSYRTPFPEEENNPELLSERPRRLWLLDRQVKEKEDEYEDISLCRSLLGHIEARHLKGAGGTGSALLGRNNDHGLGNMALDDLSPEQIRKLREPGITDQNPYVTSGLNFGGNPHWLEYLDKNILKNYEGRNLDTKIRRLSNELANSGELQDIRAIEIEAVLRGLPAGLELDIQRDVLLHCFFEAGSDLEPKDITIEFPYVTGIASPEEVHACINNALSETPQEESTAWEDFLNQSFDGTENVNAVIADFLFENLDYDQRRILYNPERLNEIVTVIKNSKEVDSEDSEAIELKENFERSLLTEHSNAAKFSVIAAHEIRPEDYPLPESVSIISAQADFIYLEKEGLLKTNEAWLKDLDSAIGLSSEQRQALMIEFLIRKHRDSFSSKEELTHSINLLQAGVQTESDEDRSLIKSFIVHINRFKNRLKPLVLNTHFPNLFQLDPTKLDNNDNLEIVGSLLSKISSENPAWQSVLSDCNKTTESKQNFLTGLYYEYLTTRLDPETKASIFASQDSLSNALATIHNAKRVSTSDKDLIIGFYRFMKTKYPKNFNLIRAQKELGKLISLNSEARESNFRAAKITDFAISGLINRSPWDTVLKAAFPPSKTSANTQSRLAVRVSKFLRETGREKEFKKIEELSNILLGLNSYDKKTLPQRRALFREFNFWLEKDLKTQFDRKLLAESFPDYFDYSDTVASEDDLCLRIQETLDTNEHTVKEDWLKVVEETITKYNSKNKGENISLARYLARLIMESDNVRINSEADLLANLGIMLGCEAMDRRRGLIDPASFAAKVREDNPDLRVSQINSFFPGALTGMIEDIDFQDPESIELNLREIFQKDIFPHRNLTWYQKLQEYLDREDLIPIVSKFLAQSTDTKIESDTEFINTLLTLLGDKKVIEKKNPKIRELLIDFLDYIHKDNALSSIKLFAHTLFHEAVPMTQEEVKQAINDHISVYIEEEDGTITPASTRAIRIYENGIEKEDAEDEELSQSDYTIKKIEKDYGISRVNLFALTGVPLLQDSDIWSNAISDSVKRSLYVNPDKKERRVMIREKGLPGIINSLQEDLQPNNGMHTNPKFYTIPSLHARDLDEREMFEKGIVRDLVTKGFLTNGTNLLNTRSFLRAVFPEVEEYQETIVGETQIANHRVIDPETKETARRVRHKIKFSTKGLYSFVHDSGDPNPRWHMLFYPLKFNGTEFEIDSKPSSELTLADEIVHRLGLPA